MFGKKKLSDEEVILEIKKGNQQALVYLYQENLPSIRNLLFKNNGKMDDVEDILQEAVIVVWQNVSKADFTLSSKLNTYLYAIAKNLWMKQLQKKQRQEPLHEVHENRHHGSEDSGAKMDAKIVVQYMDKIGDTCRDLLHLFYFDGLDMTAIAERLGFNNADTAKAKKYQCFKKLEQLIKKDFVKSDFQ